MGNHFVTQNLKPLNSPEKWNELEELWSKSSPTSMDLDHYTRVFLIRSLTLTYLQLHRMVIRASSSRCRFDPWWTPRGSTSRCHVDLIRLIPASYRNDKRHCCWTTSSFHGDPPPCWATVLLDPQSHNWCWLRWFHREKKLSRPKSSLTFAGALLSLMMHLSKRVISSIANCFIARLARRYVPFISPSFPIFVG